MPAVLMLTCLGAAATGWFAHPVAAMAGDPSQTSGQLQDGTTSLFEKNLSLAFDTHAETVLSYVDSHPQQCHDAISEAATTYVGLQAAYIRGELPESVVAHVEEQSPTLPELSKLSLSVFELVFGSRGDCQQAVRMALIECMVGGGDPGCCRELSDQFMSDCDLGASGEHIDGSVWAAACATDGGGVVGAPDGGESDPEEECESRMGSYASGETYMVIDGTEYFCSCSGMTSFAIDPATGVCIEGWDTSDCVCVEVRDGVGGGVGDDETVGG